MITTALTVFTFAPGANIRVNDEISAPLYVSNSKNVSAACSTFLACDTSAFAASCFSEEDFAFCIPFQHFSISSQEASSWTKALFCFFLSFSSSVSMSSPFEFTLVLVILDLPLVVVLFGIRRTQLVA
jgi:hypothetical protein